MKRTHPWSLCVLLLTFCPLVHAAGGLRGSITAGPGAIPIGNARVVLRVAGHDRIATSNSDGVYEFRSIEHGASYSIWVEADGFRELSKNNIVIDDGETARVDLNLQLADVHTTVLVDGGIINFEMASAEVSQTIDSTEVQELPIANPTAAKYALLDPHVRQTLGLGADYQDSMRLSINSGSYRHTSYMLDGTTNYDWVYAVTPQAVVAPASLDDVKVITGVSSAQYGSSTNGIIAITTPSGTDVFHGDFFSYIRPSGIQAAPALAPFHIPNQRLDWGANIGGPIIKGKTFFFASYERVQQDRGSIITVPSTTFFDGHTNEYSGLFRLDHSLTSKNELTGRFNGDHYATNNANDRVSNGNQPSFGRTARVRSWGGKVADQAVIGNMVNVAHFAYTNYFPDSATPLNPSVGVSIDHYNGGSTPQYQAGYSTYNWVHAQTETAGRHARSPPWTEQLAIRRRIRSPACQGLLFHSTRHVLLPCSDGF